MTGLNLKKAVWGGSGRRNLDIGYMVVSALARTVSRLKSPRTSTSSSSAIPGGDFGVGGVESTVYRPVTVTLTDDAGRWNCQA